MQHWMQLLAAIVPAAMMLQYGMLQTGSDWRNEAVWTALVVGLFGAVPVAGVEYGLKLLTDPSLPPTIKVLSIAATAGVIEETAKFLLLVQICEGHVDARRRQDLPLLALAVSLGFAAIENLGYVLGGTNWTVIAASRAITAVCEHGALGLTMGSLLVMARSGTKSAPAFFLATLWMPCLLHSLYDFPLLYLKARIAPWRALLAILWLLTTILTGATAIAARRIARPRAATYDTATGRDGESVKYHQTLFRVSGLAVIALTIGTLVFLASLHPGREAVAMAVFAFLPLMFGSDLLLTKAEMRTTAARVDQNL